jgi:hypothetical protein
VRIALKSKAAYFICLSSMSSAIRSSGSFSAIWGCALVDFVLLKVDFEDAA